MKLNRKISVPPVLTAEGGQAKRISKALELRRAILATMLWEDSFYESGMSIADRIVSLVKEVAPTTVASLAKEARSAGKLRHVPLLMARAMAPLQSHRHVVSDVLFNIIQRPDELAEFVAIYWKDKKQPLSAQVKKGLAAAFQKFDEYQLGKYNRDGAISLKDVLFLCHAKPKDKDQEKLWKKLIGGFCSRCWCKMDEHKNKKHEFVEAKLATPDTWEVALSASQGENKKEVWERLLAENKLGGLALLRNLRNFRETGVNESLIKNALLSMRTERVLPYRFIAAAKYAPHLEPELEQAMFKSVENSGRKIDGKTVLLVDVSGSMSHRISSKSELSRSDAACGLAILAREMFSDVEIYTFSSRTVAVPSRRGFALRDAITSSQSHSSTYLGNAVKEVNNLPYSRIIVFTDEQSADAVPNPRNGANGYVINVASEKNGVGYGAWNHIDGFSEAVLDYILQLERLNIEN